MNLSIKMMKPSGRLRDTYFMIHVQYTKLQSSSSVVLTYTVLEQDWKRSVFIPILKKSKAKECSNYHTTALISQDSTIILKTFQSSLQQYMNWELPDVETGFQRGRGTRNQIASIPWITEKSRDFPKNIYFYFLTTLKPLCRSQQTVEKS